MGKYVNSNLTAGEHIVYEATYHWIIFLSLKAVLTLFISPLITFHTSEFAITNKRIIMKVGLIRRRTMELNIPKVESVGVDQSIPGRILGYGSISVVGTGGTKETFDKISKPLEFRKAFQQFQS
ncbi:MAG: PH domain-containing protein [Spirochaetes bacterium]|jgi:uncharacterized membrane protein YdbT with pleckstrin-like domain|nr:PH domain-containing protein [Spirochaetota bacterium]